jgi:microcystin-dependent protein
LPNIQGLAVVNAGQGAGLSPYSVGEQSGSQTVTLTQTELPLHPHTLMATTNQGTTLSGSNNQLAKAFGGDKQANYTGNYLSTTAPGTVLSPFALTPSGSSQPHDNMQPYLTLNFCIAMQGVFPPRG